MVKKIRLEIEVPDEVDEDTLVWRIKRDCGPWDTRVRRMEESGVLGLYKPSEETI